MPEHDRQLIAEAETYTPWERRCIIPLIHQAQTQQARSALQGLYWQLDDHAKASL